MRQGDRVEVVDIPGIDAMAHTGVPAGSRGTVKWTSMAIDRTSAMVLIDGREGALIIHHGYLRVVPVVDQLAELGGFSDGD